MPIAGGARQQDGWPVGRAFALRPAGEIQVRTTLVDALSVRPRTRVRFPPPPFGCDFYNVLFWVDPGRLSSVRSGLSRACGMRSVWQRTSRKVSGACSRSSVPYSRPATPRPPWRSRRSCS